LREEQADKVIEILSNLVEQVRTLREELNGTSATSPVGQLMGSGKRKTNLNDVVDAITGIENALASSNAG
jgi:hypothetical protein